MFPLRENCDPDMPEEALLWMLVGLPVPPRMPAVYWRLVSKHFWDLGVRPAAEPVLQYHPDSSPHALFAPGRFSPTIATPPTFPHGFPLRSNCDPADPYQMFLWMFAGWPGLRGAPLMHSISDAQIGSKHLWLLGARPICEPLYRYEPPRTGDPDWLTSPGRWILIAGAP